jgi:pSer/pThr/pTyr-binding forkhead associated (FHA) protein
MPKIVVRKKAEVLAEYRIGKKNMVTIGSARGNAIALADKNISEQHCSITCRNGVCEIKDNNTIAGTKVNDKPITLKELQFEDVISVGSYSLVFRRDPRTDRKTGDEAFAVPKPLFLLGFYGRFEGKKYEIGLGETHVGRENVTPKGIYNDIILSGDMTVSKGHAKFDRNDERCTLTDSGSTGGVAVNGSKVGQLNEVGVHVNDEIAIGRTIFRIAEEGNENYSLPKQHNIFLLKIRRPVLLGVTLLAVGASLFAIGRGMNGLSIANDKPRKIDVEINRFWTPEDNTVKTALSVEYDVTSSPAIGDFNNDGKNDIVYFNSAGMLCAWDGRKGASLWKSVEIFNSGKSSPAIGDMNNDGIPDVVALSDTSMLFIVDGQTGGIISREILGGNVAELSPCVGDLNGDGLLDVVVCSEEGSVHFVYSAGFAQKMEKYSEFVEGPVYASPVVVATKKISPLVVVCSNNSKIYFFDGKNRDKKTVDLAEKTGKVHLMAAPPAVGDLDGDGIPEVVVQSNVPQYVSAIDITHFDVNWTYFVEPVPPAGLKHSAPPLIGDFHGNGRGDVIVLSANGSVYALKGKTGYPAGELLWKTEIEGGGRLIGPAAIIGSDKDGVTDIAFGTESGNLCVMRVGGQRIGADVMPTTRVSNVPITSSLAIGDINGDGKVEMVNSNVSDVVQVLTTNARTFKNRAIWPMYMGNAFRTGNTNARIEAAPFIMMVAGGIGILLVVGMVAMTMRQRSVSKRPRVVNL